MLERYGVRLAYEARGAGEPVILHHALTADRTGWIGNGMVDALLDSGRRCILFDAVGHGASGDPDSPDRISLEERVADVLAIADALALESFAFVGYSMGGWVGTGLIDRCPERLTGAVIAGWDPIAGAQLFTALSEREERREEFSNLARQLTARAPVSIGRLSSFEDAYLGLFDDLPALDDLAAHNLPLALMCGRTDPYNANAMRAAKMMSADFFRLTGDHVAAFSSPEFVKETIGWLDRASAGRH